MSEQFTEPTIATDQHTDPEHSRHRHKRKRKHSHRNKIPRQVIILSLFVLACLAAFDAWYFLIHDLPPRR